MVSDVRFLEPEGSRRAHERILLNEPGAYISPNRFVVIDAGDISATGAFVPTRYPDPVGTRAHLRLPIAGGHVDVEAEVVRVSFLSAPGVAPGMGVRFLRDIGDALADTVVPY